MNAGQIIGIAGACIVAAAAVISGGYKAVPDCGKTEIPEETAAVRETMTPEQEEAVVSKCSINPFDAEVFKDLLTDKKSVVFSPYSLHQCLGLLQPGMDDESDAGISINEQTGFFDEKVREYEALNSIEGMTQYNGVFFNKNVKSSPSYEAGVKKTGASVEKGSLNVEEFKDKINALVSKKTAGQIKKILNEPLDCDALFMNAVHFDGKWSIPFSDAVDGTFNGRTEKMMHTSDSYQGGLYKGIEYIDMPYEDVSLAMRVLIPEDKKNDILSLFSSCDDVYSSALLAGCGFSEDCALYDVSFPKLSSESDLDMTDLMQAYFPDVFESGSMPYIDEALEIAKIRQVSKIENSEKGTEASSVTTEEGYMNGALDVEPTVPREFKVDVPYIYSIYNTDNGTVYFMGYQD